MKEDYVSFETAKLLKDKGFDGETSCYYAPDSSTRWIYQHYHEFDIKDRIECPTLQMAMKWLREIHNLDIIIFREHLPNSCYWARIERFPYTEYQQDLTYVTYEESAENAIKYCLENLI